MVDLTPGSASDASMTPATLDFQFTTYLNSTTINVAASSSTTSSVAPSVDNGPVPGLPDVDDDPLDIISRQIDDMRLRDRTSALSNDSEALHDPKIPLAETNQVELSIEEEIKNIKSLTLHDKSMLNLIVHCNQTKAPKGFFNSFMATLKNEIKLNDFNVCKADTRETFMSRMRMEFPCAMPFFVNVRNQVQNVNVPPPLRMKMNATNYVRVLKFSFLDQIQDLLGDFSIFGNLDNLCVNKSVVDRFKAFQPGEDDLLVEVLGSAWYRRTGSQLSSDELDFLIPLIFYADKTGTDVNQRYSLEPWVFTLALFRRFVRESQDAWRYLGFIPDMHTLATKGMTPEEKMDLYHRCLHELLKDIADMQQNPPMMRVRLGNEVKQVRAIFKVAFIMGDQKSNDNVCCKKGTTRSAGRIHRGCMCSSLHSDDPTMKCEYIDPKLVSVITKICQNKQLRNPTLNAMVQSTHLHQKQINDFLKRQGAIATAICEFVLSFYPVQNAFGNLDFGANPYGVFRATLDDTLHFTEAGFFQYLNQVIYGPMHPKECRKVDYLVESLLGKKTLRSTSRDQFPRLAYKNGFSHLTLLTHSEKVGVILATFILLHTKSGRATLDKVFLRQQLKFQGIVLSNDPSPNDKKKVLKVIMNEPACDSLPPKKGKNTGSAKSKKEVTQGPKVPSKNSRKTPSTKSTVFPKSRKAYLFVIKQIKKHGLSIILEQKLDQLQLQLLFQHVWKECHDLYLHKHDKVALAKRFPRCRLECEGIVFFDRTVFQAMHRDKNTPVERSMFSLIDVVTQETGDGSSLDDHDTVYDTDDSSQFSDDLSDDDSSRLEAASGEESAQADDTGEDAAAWLSPNSCAGPPSAPPASIHINTDSDSSDNEPLSTRVGPPSAPPPSIDINTDSDSSDNEPLAKKTWKAVTGTISSHNVPSDDSSSDSDEVPLASLIRKPTNSKKSLPSLLSKRKVPKPRKKPLTRYPAKPKLDKQLKGKKRQKKKKGPKVPKVKERTPLQEYYHLNIVKPRRPIEKSRRKKSARSTGSTEAVLCDVFDFLHLLEFTLCWHAFTKYEDQLPFEYRNDSRAIDFAVRKMMQLFKDYFYRGDNSDDTKTCKFHSHLHTVSNRLEYGSLLQYDTGKGERNLKHTKGLAATAQKQGQETFIEQTGDRILDYFVLRRAGSVMEHLFPASLDGDTEKEVDSGSSLLKGKPRFSLNLTTATCTHLNSKGKPFKGGPVKNMDPFVVKWLTQKLVNEFGDMDLKIWCEIKSHRDPNHKFFRAHASYDQNGAWYDWAMIRFEDKKKMRSVPGKLLGFYQGTDQKEYGIAHCCSWLNGRGGPVRDSLLGQQWLLEYDFKGLPILSIFTLDAIDEGCLVIENGRDPTDGLIPQGESKVAKEDRDVSILRIIARKDEWPIQFVKWGQELKNDPTSAYLLPA